MTPPAPGAIRPLAARANLTAALDAGLLPAGCRQFIADHEAAFLTAPGSGHNHQYWTGATPATSTSCSPSPPPCIT
jgi:hypothetical protein